MRIPFSAKLGYFLLSSILFYLSAMSQVQAAKISISTLSDGTELKLNGIAKVRQNQSDYYLAALYTGETSGSSLTIDYINNPKRMQLKVTASRISHRSFGRYWKEAISINNKKSIMEDQVGDVLTFSKFFKKSLHRGDVINIDYLPAKGTFVYVNNVLQGRIKGQEFFSLVLMAWIGPRPPSADFKKGLLGGNNSDVAIKLQQEFQNLSKKS